MNAVCYTFIYWILIALLHIPKTIYSENHRLWMEIRKTNSLCFVNISYILYGCTYVYTGVFWQLFFVHIHIIMARMTTAPTLIFNKQQCICIRYIYLLYFIFHVIVDFWDVGNAVMRESILRAKFVRHIISICCCDAFNDAWSKCSKTRTSISLD